MNYIKQINAFYDQIEVNPLSASAGVLWHALMHINSKVNWLERFNVSASVLRMKSGLTESSFRRAREELSKKGYIYYQSQSGNPITTYQIASLVHHTKVSKKPLQEVTANNDSMTNQFFQENIDEIEPYLMQAIKDWLEAGGTSTLLEAMNRSAERKEAERIEIQNFVDNFSRQ